MKRKSPSSFVANLGRIRAEELADIPIDPDVKLPASVQATIAEGEEAFHRQKSNRRLQRELKARAAARGAPPGFTTSVDDQDVQQRRDAALETLQRQSKGKHGQPPMVERLRSARIVVDRLRAEGVPFATSPTKPASNRPVLSASGLTRHLKGSYPSAFEAISAAEAAIAEGELSQRWWAPDCEWRQTKKGGSFYRKHEGVTISVKPARSGSWFAVSMHGCMLGQNGRPTWFPTPAECRSAVDAFCAGSKTWEWTGR
jgi:hypothetical protein